MSRHRYRLVLIGLLVVLFGAQSAPSGAVTVSSNFDSFPDGHAPTAAEIPGVTFTDGATVFTTTFPSSSPPKALQFPAACDSSCANGAYRMRMRFASGSTSVELRAGLDAGCTCEFGYYVRMVGYDDAGHVAGPRADTGDKALKTGIGDSRPVATQLAIGDDFGRITSVVVYFGKGTYASDAYQFPARARIDDLNVVFPDSPPPPPPPPPSPPRVTIGEPPDGSSFVLANDVVLSGRVESSEPLTEFCTSVDNEDTPPAECARGSAVRSGGFFETGVPGLHDGDNLVTAWARVAGSDYAHASVRLRIVPAAAGIDPQVGGLDVLQAVQSNAGLVTADAANPGAPVPYNGTKLSRGRKTVVRVFGNSGNGPPYRAVAAQLRGLDVATGRALPGSPLLPDNGRLELRATGGAVPYFQRGDRNGAYVFTLPDSWTRPDEVALRARVNTGGPGTEIPECAACRANDELPTTLRFNDTGTTQIAAIGISYASGGTRRDVPDDPSAAFDATRAVAPFGDGQLRVPGYRAMIDVSDVFADPDIPEGMKYVTVASRIADLAFRVDGLAFGFQTGLRGYSSFTNNWFDIRPFAAAPVEYPLNGIGHEFFHAWRFFHASSACDGAAGGPTTDWGPDNAGFLQGTGLDPRVQSGGTYRMIQSNNPAREMPAPPRLRFPSGIYQPFDLMSYCTNNDERGAWISPRNWDAFGQPLPNALNIAADDPGAGVRRKPSVRAAGGASNLEVVAGLDGDRQAAILAVRGTETKVAPPAASDYAVSVLAADGSVISRTPARVMPLHVDGQGKPHDLALVAAHVPADGAATVQVVNGERVVATRAASAHPPAVRFVSPRPGRVRARRGQVTLTWRAADADGDALSTRVDLSRDGGRSYRSLTTGVRGNSVALPEDLFARSSNARVRVTVNDGFTEAEAVSGRLVLPGTPPRVRIVSPGKRSAVAAGSALYLSGEAYDDSGAPLTGRRLTWSERRTVLGRGAQISTSALRPGRHRITLRAVDKIGRAKSTTTTVTVRGERPQFLTLDAPASLGARARSFRLRVASSAPGTLTVARRSFRVGRRVRTVKIPVKPGSGPLTLRLRLSAGGSATSGGSSSLGGSPHAP